MHGDTFERIYLSTGDDDPDRKRTPMTTNTEPRIVTLSSDRGLSDMPVRVTEYRLLQLAPTVAGEERGAWMARHWLDCGYATIEGETITAESVRRHVS